MATPDIVRKIKEGNSVQPQSEREFCIFNKAEFKWKLMSVAGKCWKMKLTKSCLCICAA